MRTPKPNYQEGSKLHMLDSGAHSLLNKYVLKRGIMDYSFYRSPEFWKYVDEYAEFIKKYKTVIDVYVNVDVIFNPRLTWDVQRYMQEEHGLWPLPVVHFGTDLVWIERYMEIGHDYIGIGGLGQTVTVHRFPSWGDRLFKLISPGPAHVPIVKTHGFAIGSSAMILRYPWWSVDAATWVKMSYYGQIIVPRRDNSTGEFKLLEASKRLFIAANSPYTNTQRGKEKHFCSLSKTGQQDVLDWLHLLGIELGNYTDPTSTTGVANNVIERQRANVEYLERVSNALPHWPWKFEVKHSTRKTLADTFGVP